MISKKVLFIDDGDISNQIARMTQKLRKKGYELLPSVIDLSDSKYKTQTNEADSSLVLDFEKIKNELKVNHYDKKYALLACDFNYANDPLNGFEVVKWLINHSKTHNARFKNAPFICYSAEEAKVKQHLLENEDVVQLLKLKIDAFFHRDRISDDIPALLMKYDKKLDIEAFMVELLEQNENMKFKNTFPKFKNKTLGEIALEISRNTEKGKEFQKYLLELTYAHILALNETK